MVLCPCLPTVEGRTSKRTLMALLDGLNQPKTLLYHLIVSDHHYEAWGGHTEKNWRNCALNLLPFYDILDTHPSPPSTHPVIGALPPKKFPAERLKPLGSRSDSLKYPDFATTPLAPSERQPVVTVAEN